MAGRAVMLVQLVERSLLTPEVRGLNPINDINEHLNANRNLEKPKIKCKEARNGPQRAFLSGHWATF